MLTLLAPVTVAAAGSSAVTPLSCDAASVQQALSAGGTYQFDCNGDIDVSSLTFTVNGKVDGGLYVPQAVTVSLSSGGHNVTLDGMGKVRVLEVAGNLTLSGIAVDNGLAVGTTGAHGLDGPQCCVFGVSGANGTKSSPDGKDGIDGVDLGPATSGADGGEAKGGGLLIDATGQVTLTDVTFANDTVAGGRGGWGGEGGAGVDGGNGGAGYSPAFYKGNAKGNGGNGGNGANGGDGGDGGDGGNGGDAHGGAIYNDGALSITTSTFSGDQAFGGLGGVGWFGGSAGSGGFGGGGGVPGLSGGTGGTGGNGGDGGNGGKGGSGGDGGSAFGGAVYNAGVMTLTGSTFQSDIADGGQGGPGGIGASGGLGSPGGLTIPNSVYGNGKDGNGGDGGDGGDSGNGGSAFGGAIYSVQPLSTTGLIFSSDGVGAGGSPDCLVPYASLLELPACSGGQAGLPGNNKGGTTSHPGNPGEPGHRGRGGAGGCNNAVVVLPDQLGTCASPSPGGFVFGLPAGQSLAQPVVGQPYSSPPLVQGGTAPYTWSVTQGSMPPGLGLDTVTGGVYGTPTVAGPYTAMLQATDSSSPPQTAGDVLTLDVAAATAPGALTLQLPTPPPSATVGVPYTLTPEATGGTPPYAWRLASGGLPAGLVLNTVTGEVHGTPTTAGKFTSALAVTDSSSPPQTASAGLSLDVATAPAPAPLALQVTPSVSAATVGVPYALSPEATGGTAPYTWSVAGGSLPPGVALDSVTGEVYGTPTTAGNFTSTLAVTDSASPAQRADAQLTVAVNAPVPVTVVVTPPTVATGGQATVRGAVYDTGGNPVPGAVVDLSATGGGIAPATVTTGTSGGYGPAVLTAPGSPGAITVTARVYAPSSAGSGSAVVLVTPPGVGVTATGSGESARPGGSAYAAIPGTDVVASDGEGTVRVAGYDQDPAGASTFSGPGVYLDVSLSAGSSFTSLVITRCDLNGATTAYWWNGTEWLPASDQTLSDGCITITVSGSTSPSLTELGGTPFAVGTPLSSGGGGGGGGGAFSYAPVVSGINPGSGPAAGGTPVTLTGSRFTGATAVSFGGIAASSFTVDSDSEITATAPAGTGTVDVTVATAYGTSATSFTDQFSYTAAVAQAAPTAPGAPTFADVPGSYWAHADIEALAAKGIVGGFPDGSFRPDGPVTRAQFVKMLDLTLGLTTPASPAATAFTDVPASAWYAPYVLAALHAGIVEGTSPSTFSPAAPVTREQLAVLLARALRLTKTAPLHFSDDGTIAAWALQGVGEAVAGGYINGFPNGSLQPRGATTRAQAAKVLATVLQNRGS